VYTVVLTNCAEFNTLIAWLTTCNEELVSR
jgi:hypothetical protein